MQQVVQTPEIYVNEKAIAEQLGLSVEWLRKQRRLGQGPPFVRWGRTIRYNRRGVERWAAATMEPQNGK